MFVFMPADVPFSGPIAFFYNLFVSIFTIRIAPPKP
jgi:hypothetical protein